MVRSGKILVLKRDGAVEPFDIHKLQGCLLRVTGSGEGQAVRAQAVAAAVCCYVVQRRLRCVSSAAILEMALTALRSIGWKAAAARLEYRHNARSAMRSRLMLHHHDGRVTGWSKEWLAQHARSRWSLGRTAGRILAGQVEQWLLDSGAGQVRRAEILRMLGWLVTAYGLAEVPAAEAAGKSV